MKVLSLFSGIGAFEKAFKNMNIPVDLVAYCEIDKYASRSYSAIHDVPETMNLGDITKVDTSTLPKDIGLICYGFPCQDISNAGHMRGFEHEGERTRSGLFFEALRIIEDTQPLFAICENVKNLTSKKFEKEFEIVLSSLEAAGYNNYWQILDAKDYGIPQHRERVFIVSIRKDIDRGFEFPEKQELKLRFIDMLEDDPVDEKYFLTEKNLEHYNREFGSKGKQQEVFGIADTLCAAMGSGGGNIPILDNDAVKAFQSLDRQTVIVTDQGQTIKKKTDIANTLMARDYKGFGNQGMNAVIYP